MPGATVAFSSLGSTIAISNVLPATHDVAGYEALTFTEIGEVADIGEFGPEYSVTTFTPIKTGIVRKRKSSVNYGSMPLSMAMVPGDAGHVKLLTGLNDYDAQAFKVTYQDGTVEYFDALVMSYKRAVGGADGITMASTQLEVDSTIVTDLPA